MGMYACLLALLLRAFVQMHTQTKWKYVPLCIVTLVIAFMCVRACVNI
jgi:hypothetical protein